MKNSGTRDETEKRKEPTKLTDSPELSSSINKIKFKWDKFHLQLPNIFAQFKLIVVFFTSFTCFYSESQTATAWSDKRGQHRREREEREPRLRRGGIIGDTARII